MTEHEHEHERGPARRAARPGFPGFDAIRLLAAWAVVYAHSFPIALGIETPDPLVKAFGDHIGLGEYAVQVFFILSGFLLSASLDGNRDPLRYLTNRIARIVPGFCFAILVSVIVIAPWLSDSGWRLLTSWDAWSSIYWSIEDLSDQTAFALSAVRYPELVGFLNGSLWSIPYELVYCLVLLLLYMLLRNDFRVAAGALVLLVVTFAGPRLGVTTIDWGADAHGALRLPMFMFDQTLPYFCGGVVCYAVHKRWGLSRVVVGSAAVLLVVAVFVHLHDVAFAVAGPVLLVSIGSRRSVLSALTERVGDVSYGVYLFGWPIGLLVATMVPTSGPLGVFALSVPLVCASAYAMHRLVEIPVGTFVKPWVLARLPRFSIGPSRRPQTDGFSSWRRSAAFVLAYGFCVVMIGRFTIYPYPFSLNWFGGQTSQLVVMSAVCAAILKAGTYRA